MSLTIEVRGTAELRTTVALLKQAGNGGLLKELRKGMRTAAKPMLQTAQRNVRALDVKGARGSGRIDRYEHVLSRARKVTEATRRRAARARGLRAATAAATRVEVNTSGNPRVRLVTAPKAMPADQRNLPAHLNTGRWRHPVFGTDSWVTQTATSKGWFDRAALTDGPKVRDGARDALNDVIERIG